MKRYRKNSPVLLLPCAALLLCSCKTVMTKYPLTNEPRAIDGEKFDGVWRNGDTEVYIKFASNGIAQVSIRDQKNSDVQIGPGEMIVTEGVEHNFICIRFQEDGKWMDGYYFLQYRFIHPGDLVLWFPNNDVFEEAIQKKQLSGVIEKGQFSNEITITSNPEKLLEFINDPNNLKLFKYKEPVILWKVTEQKKAELGNLLEKANRPEDPTPAKPESPDPSDVSNISIEHLDLPTVLPNLPVGLPPDRVFEAFRKAHQEEIPLEFEHWAKEIQDRGLLAGLTPDQIQANLGKPSHIGWVYPWHARQLAPGTKWPYIVDEYQGGLHGRRRCLMLILGGSDGQGRVGRLVKSAFQRSNPSQTDQEISTWKSYKRAIAPQPVGRVDDRPLPSALR